MKILKLINLICFLFLTLSTFSQNGASKKFNLDFNEYDPDKKLPKNWFQWGKQPISTELQNKSNYVGRVNVDKEKEFGCITYVIPANYQGDSIQLTGYIKIENVKKGRVGLLMRIDGNNQMLEFDNMYDQNINGTRDWTKYFVKLPYPNKAKKIYIGGILFGKGTAWFDNFEVTIDGENIQNLKEIKKPYLDKNTKVEIIQSLQKSLNPIDFTNESTLNQSLQPLIETIGNRKIISIGEDTHGTSEYYKLRVAITKKLILEKGYNTVILESPYDDIELLTKNLKGDVIDQLMRKHLFSIYQTEEMKSFLDWYKTNNKNSKIKFKGCDDSYWVLEQLLEKELSLIEDDNLNKLFKTYRKALIASEKSKAKNKVKTHLAVYKSIVALEQYLDTKNLHTAYSKELLFNGKNTYINYKHLSENKSIQSRDEIMADRIAYLAKDPNAKIIVWAHNAHISNTVIIDDEIGIMGSDLKDEFGENYVSIGLSSLIGNYSYMTNRFINSDHKFDDQLIEGSVELQPKNSWERVFNASNDQPFYSDLSKIRNDIDNNILGDLKLIGYGKESEGDYYKLSPISMFDFLIFMNKTGATTPLSKK